MTMGVGLGRSVKTEDGVRVWLSGMGGGVWDARFEMLSSFQFHRKDEGEVLGINLLSVMTIGYRQN